MSPQTTELVTYSSGALSYFRVPAYDITGHVDQYDWSCFTHGVVLHMLQTPVIYSKMAPHMAASVCCPLVLLLFLFVCPVLSNVFSDQFH